MKCNTNIKVKYRSLIIEQDGNIKLESERVGIIEPGYLENYKPFEDYSEKCFNKNDQDAAIHKMLFEKTKQQLKSKSNATYQSI